MLHLSLPLCCDGGYFNLNKRARVQALVVRLTFAQVLHSEDVHQSSVNNILTAEHSATQIYRLFVAAVAT